MVNKQETIQILSLLKTAFPNAYKGMPAATLENTVSLWNKMFEEDSFETVGKAVYSLIATRESGWSPAIGEVKAEISKLKVTDMPTEEEAWLSVRKAVSNGLYNSEKEFKKLHPAVQKAVGAAWQLKEWANFSDADMDRISYSFKKTYRELKDTEIRNEKLPESVKGVALDVADKLRLKS